MRHLVLCFAMAIGIAACAPGPHASLTQPGASGVPGPLIETVNYAFVPDEHYRWLGPARAAGVYVWAHGKGASRTDDLRGMPPPPHVRPLNDAGYDVVRFDRGPMADDRDRAAGWLRDGLAALRQLGYARLIVGGQSRGAWNSLQMLDTPGLADAVVAVSPAAHGSGASLNLLGQTDDFRRLLQGAEPQNARVVFVQFSGDLFIGDAGTRRRMLDEILRPKVAQLLVIDQPGGLQGHRAGATADFQQRFGACIARFVTQPQAPAASC